MKAVRRLLPARFGIADQVLQSNGEVSLFFNTCSLPGTATIEDLAGAFAAFLAGLKYTNGQPVETVDVVAHSMGGLVLRCYLSGKQDASGVFQPPAATHVRKAVFLATPNFGTPIASLLGVLDAGGRDGERKQLSVRAGHLEPGNGRSARSGRRRRRWATRALVVLGEPAGFDDGVVPLTSASLRFYLPGRTRVVPYCHIARRRNNHRLQFVPGRRTGNRRYQLRDARFGADHRVVLERNERLAKRWHGCGERSVSFGGWRIDCRGARRRRFTSRHRLSRRRALLRPNRRCPFLRMDSPPRTWFPPEASMSLSRSAQVPSAIPLILPTGRAPSLSRQAGSTDRARLPCGCG